MPIDCQRFDNAQCEFKAYESSKSWIQLARAASAIGKGEKESWISGSPTADVGQMYSLGSESYRVSSALPYEEEKGWLETVAGFASRRTRVAAVPYLSPGSVYAVILDAAVESLEFGAEKSWLGIVQGVFAPGKVGHPAELYFRDLGVSSLVLDAVSSEPMALGPANKPPISQVDREYSAIIDTIHKSRAITDLHDNWDHEGARGYNVDTWKRATRFLSRQATFARDSLYSIGVPRIAPADCGSIDIHWISEDRELLINIPSTPSELGTYYGQKRSGDTISGVVNTDSPRGDLVVWLTQNKQKSGL